MTINVAIIGAGQMGSGIAQVCLTSGFTVTLCDTRPLSLESAVSRIDGGLQKLEKKGKLDDRAPVLNRLTTVEKLTQMSDEQRSGTGIWIEAVVENVGIKSEVFAAINAVAPPQSLIASNTSSISISKLAALSARASDFIGLHFFNPVPVMKLLEVVLAIQTSSATIERAQKFAKQIGKTAVVVNDSPGFVANRILLPMINEAISSLAEGIADAQSIDEIMRLGMAHPMGPLQLADYIGLDVCLAILDVLYEDFGSSKYRAHPMLRRMVDAGRLGRKSGTGFYEYE